MPNSKGRMPKEGRTPSAPLWHGLLTSPDRAAWPDRGLLLDRRGDLRSGWWRGRETPPQRAIWPSAFFRHSAFDIWYYPHHATHHDAAGGSVRYNRPYFGFVRILSGTEENTMRKITGGLLLASVSLCWIGAGRSDDADDGRAAVDEASKAAGGEERLKKHQAATWGETGMYYGMGDDGVPFTGKIAVQWPDKFYMEVESVFTIVINGDKGWIKTGEGTKEMSKQELQRAQRTNRAEWVTTLLPLTDKA